MGKGIIENAKIENVFLGIIEDKGFLDCTLYLSYGPYSQGFGGWILQRSPEWVDYSLEGPAGHFIYRVLQIAGATIWDELKGKYIRIDIVDGKIVGIGHIVDDDWFYPNDDFAPLRKK